MQPLRRTSVSPLAALLAAAGVLAATLPSASASAQTTGQATLRTITVTGARPVADAMYAIEKRYAVPIDYVDAQYSALRDVQTVRFVRGTPVRKPFPVPKVRSLSAQYEEAPGCPKDIHYIVCNSLTMGRAPVTTWPIGGVTALIQSVLDRFASQGGQVFAVRKINVSYGPRWVVYPEQVRDRSGKFVYRPDFLGATIFLPNRWGPRRPVGGTNADWREYSTKAVQASGALWESIFQQLEADWGPQFQVAGDKPEASGLPADESGGRYMTAWQAVAIFTGPWRALRLFYAADNGMYYDNIVNLPYRPPPRPPNPPPAKPLPPPPSAIVLRPDQWLEMADVRKSAVQQLQAALVEAGYLHSAPTEEWDANARQAILAFQVAKGIPTTGKMDLGTVEKLYPYLPRIKPLWNPPPAPPPNPLGPALFYWLESTKAGQKDIQRALAESGFYDGPITGVFDKRTLAALKAYQHASGLAPTGRFDDATSRKLAPLLLKMKD